MLVRRIRKWRCVFGGAFCGAILALLFTLLVMPWLDNIVGLLFVLAPISLLGAWIATSSERSSYVGTQMVVTFALATLENVLARCTTWWKFAIAPWVSSLVPWCPR